MQLLEPKKAKPSIAIFIGCLVVVFAIGFFFTLPALSDYNAKRAVVTSTQASLTQTQAEVITAQQSLQKLSSNQDELTQINYALPSDPGTPDLYAHLETLAKQSGLIFASAGIASQINQADISQIAVPPGGIIDPGAINNSDLISVPPSIGASILQFQVKGSIGSFNQFLEELERSMRVIDVTNIDISGSAGNVNNIGFGVTIRTYYQKKQ